MIKSAIVPGKLAERAMLRDQNSVLWNKIIPVNSQKLKNIQNSEHHNYV